MKNCTAPSTGCDSRPVMATGMTEESKRRLKPMPDWIWFLLIFAGYIALMRFVLPALGVQT
jgi:hypothetical protein